MKRLISSTIYLMFPLLLLGQLVQSERFEMEFNNNEDYFNVINIGPQGLMLFRELRNKSGFRENTWEIIQIDTTFQEVWRTEMTIDTKFRMTGYDFRDHSFYLLFSKGERFPDVLQLFRFNLNTQSNTRFEIKNEVRLELSHFIVVETQAILGGHANSRATVLMYDMEEDRTKILPGFFNKESKIIELKPNVNGSFNVLLREKDALNEWQLTFKSFDPWGELIFEDNIKSENPKISFLSGTTNSFQTNDLIVTGNYGPHNGKMSSGIYFLKLDPSGRQNIRYIDFGAMEHFFDYMKPKRKERVLRKIRQKKSEGKRDYFKSYLVIQNIVEREHDYLLHLEVFNPSESHNQGAYRPYYDPYFMGYPYGVGPMPMRYMGPPYPPYGMGPQPGTPRLKFYQANVLAVNKNGELLWDNAMQLENMETPGMDQITDFIFDKDLITFIYKKDDKLYYQQTLQLEKIGDKKEEPIYSEYPSDRIKNTLDEGGVRYWYGKYLYAWGYQRIGRAGDEKTKNVFFINKLHIEN
jgi:hypothetical protein